MSRVPRVRRLGTIPGAATPVRDVATSTTVTVKFTLDAHGHPHFHFASGGGSTGDVEMAPGTDTITFRLDPGSESGYNLHKVHFSPDDGNVFSQTKSGGDIVVTDRDTLGMTDDPVEYCYSVTVKRHNHDRKYTSPDPKITNEPPAQPPL